MGVPLAHAVRALVLVISVATVAMSNACTAAGRTPSHQRAGAAAPPPLDLTGEWLATLTNSNVDDFKVYLTVTRDDAGRYDAYSREGALRAMMSWRQYALGRLLRKLPPRLAALRLDSLLVTDAGDSAVFRGVFRSQVLNVFRLAGSVRHDTIRAALRWDSAGAVVGQLLAVRTAARPVVRDYGAVARAVADTMAAYVFNPRVTRSPAWQGFFTELSHRFAGARDDLDAMLGFYALVPRLRTSHILLTHDPRLATMSVDSALARVSAPPESLVTLTFPVPGVARLYVRRWERVSSVVDRAFASIDSARVHTLMLDIRGNPGGDQSSLSPAAHFVRDSTYVGVLLGNRWYREHEAAPAPEQLPLLPRSSADDLLTTFRMLREQGIVVYLMPPRLPRFTGKVFLLINGGSGSASEPLAHMLKETGRATLVGERTPGAILAAVPHPLGQGWVLFLPEADYYAADGVRLEGRGVSPHVTVPWIDAYIAVADSLRPHYPYTAALLAAQGWLQSVTTQNRATRLPLAERWAREAVHMAPDSAFSVSILASALVAQQRWDAGFAIWDSLLTAVPERLHVRYQIGRFAALSGTRLGPGEIALREYLQAPRPRNGPSHALAHRYLGMILEKKGDPSAARHEYEIGLTLEPRNPELTAALRRLGNPQPD